MSAVAPGGAELAIMGPGIRRRWLRCAAGVVAAVLVGGGASAGRPDEIVASVAVSLAPAMHDVARAYEDRYPGRRVLINAASSGVLLRQIEQGAAVDVFVSASPTEIDRLDSGGLLRPGSRVAVASNDLVLVVPRGNSPPERIEGLSDARFQRIAIGNPSTVPAGRYARQALRTLGVWDRLRDRLVLAENARQVLDYVARGEVDAGMCYSSDALLLPGRVLAGPRAPAASHRRIVYVGAVPAPSRSPGLGTELLSFLTEERARSILARRGFGPPPGT